MLDMKQIRDAVQTVAADYPIKSVRLFGSYAEERQTEKSDVDMLVEFSRHSVSLLEFFGFQQDLSDLLKTPVDIVKYPLSKEAENSLVIEKMVMLYGE